MRKLLLTSIFFSITLLNSFAQVADKAENVSPLLIGQHIPEINLLSIDGKTEKLADIIQEKTAVLIFYRGGWCPFCNAHLSAIGQTQKEILELGYQLIAISPDAPEQLKATLEKDELTYKLYSDLEGELIKAMGLAFEAPENYKPMLDKYAGGNHAKILPIPALFVVNTEGTILFEYVSPDYKNRISADLLLSVLTSLKKEKEKE